MAGIAGAVIDRLEPGRRYILGPGTTTKVIAGQLGLPKTLVGVDVIAIAEDGPRLLVADAGEAELRTIVGDGPASIVVTPIGGQGFVLGRGNQPISPVVVRSVGREGIIVIATPAKLAALGGRPLLVDTGDPGLDQELAGHIRVVTGRNDDAVTRVEPA
jgi:predicted polyphosphate/ATP-dependent NAD kinase